MIAITDDFDGLQVYHYTDCTLESPEDIKQTRGIIKEQDQIVCKTFPFTPELRSDDPALPAVLEPFLTAPAFQSLEGTLLRIWYRKRSSSEQEEGEWYLSTHRKIDAFLSRWGSDLSYGEYFVEAMIRSAVTEERLRDITSFHAYSSRLDPNKIYVLLLRTGKENRIVCTSQEQPSLYTVGAFLRDQDFLFQYATECSETLFPPIPRVDSESYTCADIIELVNQVNPFDSQGIIYIRPNGTSLKILQPQYEEIQRLRGNVPNVLMRYIQLRNTAPPEEVIRYQDLYQDFRSEFVQFERILREIQYNVHRKYMTRFIHHKMALVPPEQYAILRELHHVYQTTRTIITLDVIIDHMKTMTAGKLMYLYRKFIEREHDLGNGNYVTEEERQHILHAR